MAYVDTEKVLETARDGFHSDFGRSMADLTSLREVLEDTPTADVVEVKHGEWIRPTIIHGITIAGLLHCSVCGEVPCDEGKYCPNCGAKMDGEKR